MMFFKMSMTKTVTKMITRLNMSPSAPPAVFLTYLKTSTMKSTEVSDEKIFFVKDVIGENWL